MRVAHIITRMIIGGAQENTLYNCLDLIQQFGDDVLLITGPSTGPEGELLAQSRTQGGAGGLPVHQIDALGRAIHPWHDYRALQQLRNAIADFRPDVVHTHSAKGGFLGRAAAWGRVPCVIHTVHGAPFHPYQSILARNLFIRLERWAAKRCHHMICVADAMTDLMVDAGVADRSKFTTIYSGMDVEPFRNCHKLRQAARAQLGFQESDVVVGKIARLFHLKGHEYLVQAAREVVAKNPHVHFLFVGDGILREQLNAQIADSNLTKHFHFVGLVPPEQIPYYLSSMDMLAHTSLREGLARTLPQALIAGKPVISYDVDGAREVAITGQTGFLLPPKSIGPLSEAILELAADPALRERLGQGGASRFTDQFRHTTMTAKIRELYDKILREQTRLLRDPLGEVLQATSRHPKS